METTINIEDLGLEQLKAYAFDLIVKRQEVAVAAAALETLNKEIEAVVAEIHKKSTPVTEVEEVK